ncbi:mycothiol synthase [Phaeacidiphilus oryzae]|uniref:mycothiol synthase n=1 Tax=Phaeacidiphilus oryzae TaxID=348818 RepID=UPI000560A1C0|nr:mycothiol synthase [Phaeacidiphilus oryzae]
MVTGISEIESLGGDDVAGVEALLARAAREDGRPAVSEQGRLRLRRETAGVRHLLRRDEAAELVGYAQVDGGTGELVVDPGARRRGHGRALLDAALQAGGEEFWAHGGHPGARRLAEEHGLALVRELRQMRRPLAGLADLPEPVFPEGVRVRTFVPGEDDAAWLALNAAAFAHHPEQGSWTEEDLKDRLAEPWFDPKGFFLAERAEDGRLIGFHWTKVHEEPGEPPIGEVYVVGVDPNAQGGGLGRALTAVGLRHLAGDRGLSAVLLYVDADNTPAVRVYERMGFTVHEVDLMYGRQ